MERVFPLSIGVDDSYISQDLIRAHILYIKDMGSYDPLSRQICGRLNGRESAKILYFLCVGYHALNNVSWLASE